MNRNIIGCAIALAAALSGSAQAQSSNTVDWSGFYVGGQLGGTYSKSDLSSVTGRLQYFEPTDALQIARVGNNEVDQWRLSGGVVGGYNQQYGNVLVGVEASVNSISLDKNNVRRQEMDANPGSQSTIRQSVSADMMAALRLRLGWAQDNWLAYVTGGVATTRLKVDSSYTDNAFSGFSRGTKSSFVTGWTLGVGGEYALNRDWSLRGDYQYTRFGNVTAVSDVTSTNNSGGTMIHNADLDTHGLFIGLTYRFKSF